MADRTLFFFVKKMTRTKAEGTDLLNNDPLKQRQKKSLKNYRK